MPADRELWLTTRYSLTKNNSIMKYKKRIARLEARIKEWQTSGGKNNASGHLHTKPGSLNK